MRIAYLSNSSPEASEPYVFEEIEALQHKGAIVTRCGVYRGSVSSRESTAGIVTLFPLHLTPSLAATWLLVRRFRRIRPLLWRAIQGPERLRRRLRTLVHTWLGAYFAVIVKRDRVPHIHVHHGYFAAWIGMAAAQLLDINFSLTLHGSDLLLRADYLDAKLKNCQSCFTISEFNRHYILDRHPEIDADKVVVQHLGIDPNAWKPIPVPVRKEYSGSLHLLAVGRLHAVKNHAFLVLACRALKSAAVDIRCKIAGEGAERQRLETLIAELGLSGEVELLGQVPRTQLAELYSAADVVVLTSHSEGIPLTLMEAMAMERVVLAPAITGIPELVCPGKTGFLYRPGSMEDFLTQLQLVIHGGDLLSEVCRAARQHVLEHFNSAINLRSFANNFLTRAQLRREQHIALQHQAHEDSLLQQI